MKTTVADKPLMHTIKISPGLSSSGEVGAVSLAVQPRILFRVVLGAVLRARRQESGRTLREVSREAQVSLGYLSEIERGQKEASSELLAAVCRALGLSQSEIFSDVVTQMALSEMASAFVSVPSN